VELKIVDSDDFSKELPQDGEAAGELLVRGPWTTIRYYNRYDEAAANKFVDGWLATGDICSIKNGSLIIKDRSKDVIKSGGEWISSIDLENHISELVWVDQCAVVAQPHPKWDERPVLVVTFAKGATIATDGEALRAVVAAHCASKFAKYEHPGGIAILHV
jgi:fatty-acyl-CoA synthase